MKSWHFIPASKGNFYSKIGSLGASAIILDLEDGIASDEQEIAIDLIKSNSEIISNIKCYLRINNLDGDFNGQELGVLSQIDFNGIILPKVKSNATIERFIQQYESFTKAKWSNEIIALIESLEGIENIDQIIKAKKNTLIGIGLGLEDLMTEIPQLTLDDSLISYIKTKVSIKCHASNLLCIDSVSLNYRDEEQFILECKKSNGLLFNGKFSIHPFQIKYINEYYSPTEQEILWANEVADATGLNTDNGYLKIEGRVVSPPIIKKAKLILDKANQL